MWIVCSEVKPCLTVLWEVLHSISWEAEPKREALAGSPRALCPLRCREGWGSCSLSAEFVVTCSAHWTKRYPKVNLAVQERYLWLGRTLAGPLSLPVLQGWVLWMHCWLQCLQLMASFCLYKHKVLHKCSRWEASLHCFYLVLFFSAGFFFHFLAITDRFSGPCPDD